MAKVGISTKTEEAKLTFAGKHIMFHDSNFNNCVFVSKGNEPLSFARLLGNILFDSDSEHQEPIKQDHCRDFRNIKDGRKVPCRVLKQGTV